MCIRDSRSAYYNYYTQNRWGDAHNYDLAINAALGRETCVKMILDAAAALSLIHIFIAAEVHGVDVQLDHHLAVAVPIFAVGGKGVLQGGLGAVSYTHLDVYKRQVHRCARLPHSSARPFPGPDGG